TAGGSGGARPDGGEHAAPLPAREGPYEPYGAVELDPGVAGGLLPGQLPGVPPHERFGVGGEGEILVQTGKGCLSLCRAWRGRTPVPLVGPEAGEVQPDDHAPARESVATERVAHRP